MEREMENERRENEREKSSVTVLLPPLLSQTNPAHEEWETGRIMKKVGRRRNGGCWYQDLNSRERWLRMKIRKRLPPFDTNRSTMLSSSPYISPSFILYSLAPSFVNSVFAFILIGHCVRFTTQQNGSSRRFALFFCGTPLRKFLRGAFFVAS